MQYAKRADEDRSSLHWGQLKLMESELYALTHLTEAAKPGAAEVMVIYAGAAPGTHLPELIRMFPGVMMEAYDPGDFAPCTVEFADSSAGRLSLHQRFFDETVVAEIRARVKLPVMFVSDIRTADPRCQELSEVEATVQEDQQRQMEWCLALKPDVAVLKFRLPWSEGRTRYLKGKVLVQLFAPCTSTETRLIVRAADGAYDAGGLKDYEHTWYEDRLMYHNCVTRAGLFDHGVIGVPGLDACYDCAALAQSVRDYLAQSRGRTPTEPEVATELNRLISCISNGSRTLAQRYHVSSARHNGRHFPKRKFRRKDGGDEYETERPMNPKRARGHDSAG